MSASWPTLGPKPPGVFGSRHLPIRNPQVGSPMAQACKMPQTRCRMSPKSQTQLESDLSVSLVWEIPLYPSKLGRSFRAYCPFVPLRGRATLGSAVLGGTTQFFKSNIRGHIQTQRKANSQLHFPFQFRTCTKVPVEKLDLGRKLLKSAHVTSRHGIARRQNR